MTHNRVAGAASMALGLGIAANALLGPLAFGIIKVRESANLENQLLGGELTSLLFAAPLAFAGGILWWRGNALGPFITIGPAGFALYTYIQFVLAPDYARYPGNNEFFFPLYLTLVILSWGLIWRSWYALERDELAPLGTRLSRALGAMCVLLGSAFALAWLATIAAQLGGASTVEYTEHPTAFWLVRLMDLAFVIPIGLLVGIALLRRTPGAARGAYAYVGTQTLLACAVAGMAIRMWVRRDPGITAPLLIISAAGAAAFIVLYVQTVRTAARGVSRAMSRLESSELETMDATSNRRAESLMSAVR
jgi:hypothetical protein